MDKVHLKTETGLSRYIKRFLILGFAAGLILDFSLSGKSSQVTQKSWKTFAVCMEKNVYPCKALIPPGQDWGNWYIEIK